MPTIQRPETDVQRLKALEAAKRKADITAPADLASLARLIIFLTIFRTQMQERGSKVVLSVQCSITSKFQ